MKLLHRYVLWLVSLAAIVHCGLLFFAHHRSGRVDGYAFHSLDAKEYYQIACNLVDHGVFSQSKSEPYKPDTWRTPGYPVFLAALIIIFGKSTVTLIIMQQLLAIFNVYLFYRIARTWMQERRAFVTALLFLLEPYHLYYSLWLLAATLFVTLLLITWLIWLRFQKSPGWGGCILLGLLCGLLVLVRPGAVLIPIAVFLGLLVLSLQRHRRGRTIHQPAVAPVVFTVVWVIVLSSWMLRNKNVTGHYALSDQSGVVFAYFKATEIVLWREGKAADRYQQTSLDPSRMDEPHTVWESIDEQLRHRLNRLSDEQLEGIKWPNLAQGNKTSVDSFLISEALEKIGWSYIVETPISSLACGLVRCGSILTFPLNLAIRPPNGIEVSKVRSAIFGMAYLALVLLLLLKLYRHRWRWIDVYFPLACTAALLMMTTPQIDPRFRVPMIPLLLILALIPDLNRELT